MKKLLYLLVISAAFVISACRKSSADLNIKQYDDQQIQNYISANGLTGMKRDLSGGDTTGIYYQILSQGTGSAVDYPSIVSYDYTYHTFDNSFSTTDTIINHTNNFLGHVSPSAVMLSIKNIMKTKGTRVRLLIPSRLAFGTNGYFSGGININGNQCLDYTLYLVNNDPILNKTLHPVLSPTTNNAITYQTRYDSLSIEKYKAANSLTGYNKITSNSGYVYFYKTVVAGTGTDPISLASTVGVQYTGYLLNNTAFDTAVTTDGTAATSFTLYDVVDGFSDALTRARAGAQISIIIPSAMGYGDGSSSAGVTTIPAFSCLRFDITVVSVTN